ncbi:ATP-binding cassette transporter [Cryptococcus neoformans AD2-60a]|nr:ATP-binding cassette transporter [Cryptococcus neoformans var. grubii Bt1]OWZ34000.1 ATP-binding cassette transporter [Cryptococcus neoformans var. grubii AD2-60a]OWZ49059.1 ATP-binding cassette transporter [Cryptococcus neoformans var. grubii AD1-83a]OWZ56329.1 ATP-binding cassette transporter [Cryptococcus neoformans var. grubii 125.91]OWZ70817.1 hypothetical protein AYX14_03792 [Cryptococcus neoformans var. grubii]OWZ79348.1 ATP-binding cassette transporter [Cryptococcus neoformans var. 
MPRPFLSVKDLTIKRDSGSPILENLSLDVSEGEVLVIRGPSGSGKSTLLKCMAELNLYQSGTIELHGQSSQEMGIPNWRVKVQYVPQRPSILPGTPYDLLETVKKFSARKASQEAKENGTGDRIDPMDLAVDWGIEKTMWRRNWDTLSGGEAQRLALALAVGIGGAEVLLLDEPTSALDEETSKRVERSLINLLDNQSSRGRDTGLKALVWITHSAEQAERVATRTFDIQLRR